MERVDWVVCHSGADIWQAKGYGKETTFDSDENYEELLDFRWAPALFLTGNKSIMGPHTLLSCLL